MASTDLARWQRFASKGGIGKSTALVDCVAERDGDLMFLKDDEITVLMQLPQEGYYLGFCEGVVGRFALADVRVHGKLKRAVMARRPASALTSPSASPIALSTTPSPSVPHTTFSPVLSHPIDQITAHARAGSGSLTGSSALLLSTGPVLTNSVPEPERVHESTPPSSPFRQTSSPTTPLRIATSPTPATRESVTSLASTAASPLSEASAYSLRRNPNGTGDVIGLGLGSVDGLGYGNGDGTRSASGSHLRDSRSPTTNTGSRASSSSIGDPFQHDSASIQLDTTLNAGLQRDTTLSTLTSTELLETPVAEDHVDQNIRIGGPEDASQPVEQDAYPSKRESTLSYASTTNSPESPTNRTRVASAALSDGELGIGLTLIGGLLGSGDQPQSSESGSGNGSESDYGREDDTDGYEDRGHGYGTAEYGYEDEDTSLYRDDSVEGHEEDDTRLGESRTFLGGDVTPLAGAVTPTPQDHNGEGDHQEQGAEQGGRTSPASTDSRSSTPPFGFELEPTVNLEHGEDPDAEESVEEAKDAPVENGRPPSVQDAQSSPIEPAQQHRRGSIASSASSDYGNELPPSNPNPTSPLQSHSSPNPSSPPADSDSDSDLELPPIPRPPYHRASSSLRSITSSDAGGYYDDGIYDHYRYSHVSMAARSVRMSWMSGNNEMPPLPDAAGGVSGRRRDWGDGNMGMGEGGERGEGSQGPLSPGSQGPLSPSLHGPRSPGSQGPRSPLVQGHGQGGEPASPRSMGSGMSPLAAGPVLQAQMEKNAPRGEPLSVVTTLDPSAAGLTPIATSGLPPASPSGLTVPPSPLPSSPPSPALSSNLASSLRQAIEQQRAGSGSTATNPDIYAQAAGKDGEEDQDRPVLGSPLTTTQPQMTVTPASLQRRPSQFAPHPNAPKPAHLFTASSTSPSSPNPNPSPNPTSPAPPTPSTNPTDTPHPNLPLQDALHLVLQRLRTTPAAGGRGSTPTIHGRTHSELALSTGPVPISFVFDPDGWSVRPSSTTGVIGVGVGMGGGGMGGHGAQRSASMNVSGSGGGEYVGSKLRPRSRSFSAVPEEQLSAMSAAGEVSASGAEVEIRAGARIASAPATPSPLVQPPTPGVPQTPMTPSIPDTPARTPESPVRSSPNSPVKRVASPPSNPTPSSGSKSPFRGLRTVASNTMMRVGLHSGSVPPSPSHVVKRRSSDNLQQPSRVASPAQKQFDDNPRNTLGAHTPSSASISTSPMASSSMSLHSKSSAGLRTARGTAPATDTPTTPLSPVGSVQLADETVHVNDMDFDLVKPMRSRVSVIRTSEDVASIPRSSHQSDRTDDDDQLTSPTSPIAVSPAMQTQATAPTMARAGSHNSLTTPASIAAHISREHRWISTMQTIPSASAKRNKKIKKLLLEGVPASVRGVVWLYLTDSKARRMAGLYSQLGKRGKVPAMPEILKDIELCFTAQPHLQAPDGPAVSIMQAYLTMVPDITYSQGLCQIAGNLLMHSPEEDAFWTFVALMDRHLRGYCALNSLQMEADSVFFAKALESNDPQVAAKLFRELGIGAIDFCRPWILSGFVGIVPSEYSSRIWDVFLFEGAPFLFRTALALLACLKKQIMAFTAKSSPGVLAFLLSIPIQALPADPDQLVASAYAVKFKDDDMRKARPKIEAQLRKEPGFNRPVPIRDALKK